MFRYLYIILILFLFSCKSDGELSMERGIHYYDWKMYNEAILEFNKSKFHYMSKNNKSYEDIKLLAQTHYNLAITYSEMNQIDKAKEFLEKIKIDELEDKEKDAYYSIANKFN